MKAGARGGRLSVPPAANAGHVLPQARRSAGQRACRESLQADMTAQAEPRQLGSICGAELNLGPRSAPPPPPPPPPPPTRAPRQQQKRCEGCCDCASVRVSQPAGARTCQAEGGTCVTCSGAVRSHWAAHMGCLVAVMVGGGGGLLGLQTAQIQTGTGELLCPPTPPPSPPPPHHSAPGEAASDFRVGRVVGAGWAGNAGVSGARHGAIADDSGGASAGAGAAAVLQRGTQVRDRRGLVARCRTRACERCRERELRPLAVPQRGREGQDCSSSLVAEPEQQEAIERRGAGWGGHAPCGAGTWRPVTVSAVTVRAAVLSVVTAQYCRSSVLVPGVLSSMESW